MLIVLSHTYCSPAKSRIKQSSLEDSLGSDAMDSGTTPTTTSPKHADDAEVSSLMGPGQVGAGKTARAAPRIQNPVAGHTGEGTAAGTIGGGRLEFDSHPDTVPEIVKVPESDRKPSLVEGGAPVPPVISVQPGVPNALLTVLNNASIIEEHSALMGAEIEKIRSAESGLTEARTSLLIGFEVSDEA